MSEDALILLQGNNCKLIKLCEVLKLDLENLSIGNKFFGQKSC